MKFLSDILAKAGLTVDGVVTLNNTATGQTPNANDNSTKLATTAWVRTFVQPYSLPIATSSVLGGIKVGTGLSIDAGTGVLSAVAGGSASIKSTQTFTATAAQTVFTITGGYTVGLIDVFLNGVYLSPNQTTATNGSTVTLGDAAAAGDIIDVIIASPVYQGATTTTDQLPEGSTNLYFTNARARAAISESVTGLDYNSATGVLSITTGYGIPTTASQTTWDAAYNDKINSAAVTGTTTKTLTLTQQDGGTITASWTDNNTDAVTSVFGRTGAIVAVSGDYTTAQVTEVTNLYYTDARARAAISVTGSGSYNSATGVITVTGGVTSVNTLTGAVTLTTTNIGEGTNLYYTTARANSDFDTRLATKSTTNLAEGTNLYYTTARANSDFDTRLATKSTTNLAEGTNLYYTDTRVGTYLTGNSYATQSYVSTQINNLVSGAPGLLDTLDELAAALGDDPNFATTVSTALGNRLRIDIGTQGLTGTQQGYGRTNLGLGSLSTLSSIGNSYITDLAWSKLTSTPTTISGYGITNAYTDAQIQNFFNGANAISGYNKTNWDTAYGWGNHASGGYLTTASAASTYVSLSGSYANPSWITSLAYSKITGVPAFITSYTEVDTLATVTGRGATTTAAITVTASEGREVAVYMPSSYTTDDLVSGHEYGWYNDHWRLGMTRSGGVAGADFVVQWNAARRLSLTNGGNLTVTGTISASNYSGTHSGASSGTNTGDQTNISGNAATSTAASALSGGGTVTTAPTTNQLFYTGQISSGASGLFTATDNSNSIITLNRHPGNYDSQLGFSSNGNIYYRSFSAAAINTSQAWQTIWTSTSLTNLNQLTNGPGYITGYTETDTLASVTARGSSTTAGINVNGRITASAGGTYAVTGSSTQRYIMQALNTSNSVNAAYGWWWFHNTNGDMGFHADGIGDILTLTRGGGFTINGNTVLTAGNYNSYAPTLTGTGASGTWAINITGSAGSATTSSYTSNISCNFLGTGSVNVNNGSSAVYRNENGAGGNLNYAPVLHLAASDTMWQIQGDYYSSTTLQWRAGYSGTWYAWRQILHSANYSSYALPIGGGTLTGNRPITFDTSGGGVQIQGDSGGWGTGYYFKGSDGNIKGGFGALGGGTSLSYLWIGPAYNSYWAKVSSSGIDVSSGYISTSNPWGTANSAYFPNGITTAGGDNWIYGHTYIGNAPSNGSGHEFWTDGSEFHRSSVGTASHGQSGKWITLQTANGNFIPYSFESDRGNHSWGTVSRFRINNSESDRPSIQFSWGGSDNRWNVGYCYADDNFRITQNMGYRNDNSTTDGWGTERFKIDTSGNITAGGKLSVGTTYAGFAANIAGTVYVIGGQIYVNDGYQIQNTSGNAIIVFNSSALSFTGAATFNSSINAGGNITGNYILGSYFNSSAGNSENPTIGQIWTQSTGDNYLRKSTPAHLISQLGLITTGNIGSQSVSNATTTSQRSFGYLKATSTSGYIGILSGYDESSRVYADGARQAIVVNADYYPVLHLNAYAGTNTNHGAYIVMSGTLSAGGFRQWTMGIANYNPAIFSIGYNDNMAGNGHYGTGDGWSGTDAHHGRLIVDTAGNTKIRGMLYVNGTSGGMTTGSAVIHAGNIGSQSVNYANSAGSAGSVAWTNVSSRPTTTSAFTNDSGFITSGSNVVGLYSSGFGNGNFTWYQSPGGLQQYGGSWSSFLISNHGAGVDYYNQTIIMPFWGAPQYMRKEGNVNVGPWTFYTTENLNPITTSNIGSQSVSYASTAGNTNSISNALGNTHTWTGAQNNFLGNGNTGGTNNVGMIIYSTGGNGAQFSFHRSGAYAINMGLDSDNVIRIGGWSASANRFQMDMSGNLTMSGDITAYSDARVKTNIQTIENALEKTLALRGVTYNRTDSEDTRTKVGVIAQETLPILPEVVNQDNDGMYNVSYGNITALLIEAIKEQQVQIESQKSEIDELKGLVQQLINR